MINYEKQILKNQINMRQENEIIAWEVLYAVERQIQVRIINPNLSATANIINILTNPYYSCYRDSLIKTLKLFQVEERNIIEYLVMYYTKANSLKQKFLEFSYKKLPYFEEIIKEDELNIWSTSVGFLKFKSFESQLNKQEIKEYQNCNCYQNHCFSAVETFARKYPNAFITTIELERLFGTPMFHAVLTSKDKSIVYDIANNVIFKESSFYETFNPQEISNIRCDQYLNVLRDYNLVNSSVIPNVEDVLRLALAPKNVSKINNRNL